LTRTDEGGFEAKVTAKVGPVRAKFGGKVELSDIDPPNGYTISGQGTGGAAGFAKGGANVALAEDGGDTVLSYTVDASVGGKLAQIGSRLIDATAKKMADDFFSNFAGLVGGGAPAGAEIESAPAETSPASGAGGLPAYMWVGGIIAVVVILLLVFAR
jgi:carbon monoxide dehydrogenase subunit G